MEKLLKIDKKIIYSLLIFFLILPMFLPLNIPLSISSNTKAVYDYIEALPAGSKVLLALDLAVTSRAELSGQIFAIAEHCVMKNHKIYMVALWDAGPMFGEQVVDAFPQLTYGEDIVNLGYTAGGETGVAFIASNILNAYPVDYRGNQTKDLPMMKEIGDINTMDFIYCFGAGSPGPREWIRQVVTNYQTPFAAGVLTTSAAEYAPYVQAGQMVGVLGGLRGGAEYELLIGKPGASLAKMDSESIGHLYIIALIVIGNIGYFATKKNKK
ncbi:MAG: hypothetical protein LLG09_02925 [Negativicutes bacterium]|nr:hypothetical protein [Negativicutes bacterium]